jgi:hypothetical protein
MPVLFKLWPISSPIFAALHFIIYRHHRKSGQQRRMLMNHRNSFLAPILALLTLAAWQYGNCQNVVQNPTASQTINQPSGTNFNVNGVQTLLWPGVFRIANETGSTMVFRDMTQTDAWFMVTKNLGSSTGDIEFFGNFTNSGALIANGASNNGTSKGAVGTISAPWASVVAVNGVFGGISKGVGSFKIDHPLDPLHKYLQHSFVESPDMMNVYNGLVTLDDNGEAWVLLPNYFQTLNSDYRYQLTSIGRPNPDLFIAQEVAANKFKIAGGKPGSKVSWQVTGIRQDPYAKAHRIQVETEKPLSEQGKYLFPDAYQKQPQDALASAPADKGMVVPVKGDSGHETGNPQ